MLGGRERAYGRVGVNGDGNKTVDPRAEHVRSKRFLLNDTFFQSSSTRARQNQIHGQKRLRTQSSATAYGGFDRELDFNSHEWSCS